MKKKNLIQGVFYALISLAILAPSAWAQDDHGSDSRSIHISTKEDGKVQLKVIIQKGSDEIIVEKTYDSHSQMYNDPDLEKYGIDLSFGQEEFSGGSFPQFFFGNAPSSSFWEEGNFAREMEEFKRQMQRIVPEFESYQELLDSLMTGLGSSSNEYLQRYIEEDIHSNHYAKVIKRSNISLIEPRDEDIQLSGVQNAKSLPLNELKFSPHPSDGRLTFELDLIYNDTLTVILLDQQGAQIFEDRFMPDEGFLSGSIDLSDQASGTYILKLEQNNKVLIKRVLIE